MTVKRTHRPDAEFRREPKFARFALLSMVLHLAAALLFSGVLKPRPVLEHRPVYFVDLSKLPVANPRAGRPDGAAKPSDKPSAPKPPPAAPPKKAAAAPPKSAQPQKPVEPVSKPEKPTKEVKSGKTVAAAKPKSEKATANSSKTEKSAPDKPKQAATSSSTKTGENSKAEVEKNYQETLSAIQAMQAKAEREALKERLAALASMDTRKGAGGSGGGDVPLGMPDGTGDEVGVSQELWLQTFLKQNWSFSKYQASRRDLEATTRIIYDANGKLVSYEFVKKSGDSNFDDSVTKAILKEKQLPFPLKRRINVEVIFNLKDLMD